MAGRKRGCGAVGSGPQHFPSHCPVGSNPTTVSTASRAPPASPCPGPAWITRQGVAVPDTHVPQARTLGPRPGIVSRCGPHIWARHWESAYLNKDCKYSNRGPDKAAKSWRADECRTDPNLWLQSRSCTDTREAPCSALTGEAMALFTALKRGAQPLGGAEFQPEGDSPFQPPNPSPSPIHIIS